MTRKEKIEIMKQETKEGKKISAKPVRKFKSEHPDKEMEKIQEELKAFAEKTRNYRISTCGYRLNSTIIAKELTGKGGNDQNCFGRPIEKDHSGC